MKTFRRIGLAAVFLLVGALALIRKLALSPDPSRLKSGLERRLARLLRRPLTRQNFLLPDGSLFTVYTLDLVESNAYLLVTDAGVTLVDAGSPLMAELILDYLVEIGRTDLRLIYITHPHGDHYGSAAEVRRRTGAPIAAFAAGAIEMDAGMSRLGSIRGRRRLSRLLLPIMEPALQAESAAPDILLDDGARLDEYGLPATALYTPGHTLACTTLLIDGGLAFVGDLLSSNRTPHIQSWYAQDWGKLMPSVRRLADRAPRLLFPGHGARPLTQSELDDLCRGDRG